MSDNIRTAVVNLVLAGLLTVATGGLIGGYWVDAAVADKTPRLWTLSALMLASIAVAGWAVINRNIRPSKFAPIVCTAIAVVSTSAAAIAADFNRAIIGAAVWALLITGLLTISSWREWLDKLGRHGE